MRVLDRGASRRRAALAAGAIVLGAIALVAAGCEEEELVCLEQRAHVALIASTSKTDYDLSVELAPEVARGVMRHVARSCGELLVGIQDGRPDSNLELVPKRFKPRLEKAFGPESVREDLFEEGNEFVESELLRPLREAKPIGGSPFFATIAKTRREADARGWPPVTIVLIGDGFVVERAPESRRMVLFGQESVSDDTLAEFTSLLGDLNGSCVMVVGFGADTQLRGHRIRETERLLREAVEMAGATFVATRSRDVSPECPRRG
jgi:hypothetical protein